MYQFQSIDILQAPAPMSMLPIGFAVDMAIPAEEVIARLVVGDPTEALDAMAISMVNTKVAALLPTTRAFDGTAEEKNVLSCKYSM